MGEALNCGTLEGPDPSSPYVEKGPPPAAWASVWRLGGTGEDQASGLLAGLGVSGHGHLLSRTYPSLPAVFLFFFVFFFLVFLGPHPQHMEVPRLVPSSNRSCSHWPTPQPQQLRIQATSATYTTAHGNPRSLTH